MSCYPEKDTVGSDYLTTTGYSATSIYLGLSDSVEEMRLESFTFIGCYPSFLY